VVVVERKAVAVVLVVLELTHQLLMFHLERLTQSQLVAVEQQIQTDQILYFQPLLLRVAAKAVVRY
jgi:hypothetical protein